MTTTPPTPHTPSTVKNSNILVKIRSSIDFGMEHKSNLYKVDQTVSNPYSNMKFSFRPTWFDILGFQPNRLNITSMSLGILFNIILYTFIFSLFVYTSLADIFSCGGSKLNISSTDNCACPDGDTSANVLTGLDIIMWSTITQFFNAIGFTVLSVHFTHYIEHGIRLSIKQILKLMLVCYIILNIISLSITIKLQSVEMIAVAFVLASILYQLISILMVIYSRYYSDDIKHAYSILDLARIGFYINVPYTVYSFLTAMFIGIIALALPSFAKTIGVFDLVLSIGIPLFVAVGEYTIIKCVGYCHIIKTQSTVLLFNLCTAISSVAFAVRVSTILAIQEPWSLVLSFMFDMFLQVMARNNLWSRLYAYLFKKEVAEQNRFKLIYLGTNRYTIYISIIAFYLTRLFNFSYITDGSKHCNGHELIDTFGSDRVLWLLPLIAFIKALGSYISSKVSIYSCSVTGSVTAGSVTGSVTAGSVTGSVTAGSVTGSITDSDAPLAEGYTGLTAQRAVRTNTTSKLSITIDIPKTFKPLSIDTNTDNESITTTQTQTLNTPGSLTSGKPQHKKNIISTLFQVPITPHSPRSPRTPKTYSFSNISNTYNTNTTTLPKPNDRNHNSITTIPEHSTTPSPDDTDRSLNIDFEQHRNAARSFTTKQLDASIVSSTEEEMHNLFDHSITYVAKNPLVYMATFNYAFLYCFFAIGGLGVIFSN
jgi:hypothetical protein